MIQIVKFRKVLGVLFLSVLSVNSALARQTLWTEEFAIQDHFSADQGRILNVIGYRVKKGDVFFEINQSNSHISELTGTLRGLDERMYRMIERSLKSSPHLVKSQRLNLEKTVYDRTGQFDRVLQFDLKDLKVHLEPSLIQMLQNSGSFGLRLEARPEHNRLALVLEIVTSKGKKESLTVFPWKMS